MQKGETSPVGELTVSKGQRSIREIVCLVSRFALLRSEVSREVILGTKVLANAALASLPLMEDSNAGHEPYAVKLRKNVRQQTARVLRERKLACCSNQAVR